MLISFSPIRIDRALTLRRVGTALVINGVAFDFGPLKDGDTRPRDAVDCDMLDSDVTRVDGVLHLTLLLPHGANAPQETLFPEPLLVTQDGDIALPPYTAPTEQLT